MLVERGAVETPERPGVLGEVGGHPVHDDADAGLMQRVDQGAELVGGAEARRRRVVRGDLVSPGSAERVLGDGQQLDVGEPLFHNIIGQLMGELAIAEAGTPGAEVDFVGAHRLEHRVARRARRHPGVVIPACSR